LVTSETKAARSPERVCHQREQDCQESRACPIPARTRMPGVQNVLASGQTKFAPDAIPFPPPEKKLLKLSNEVVNLPAESEKVSIAFAAVRKQMTSCRPKLRSRRQSQRKFRKKKTSNLPQAQTNCQVQVKSLCLKNKATKAKGETRGKSVPSVSTWNVTS